jgi:hydrogenase maturation factor
MPETGKIDRSFFENVIASRLGASRTDVSTGPAHGVDFGVIDVDGAALALATDPISVLPELGFERAGEFAIRFVLTDVAVSGLDPSHLAVSFALPPEMTDEEFGAVWTAIDRECRDLGVAVTTGHTARYDGCTFPWVGHGTAMAVGEHDDIIYPNGATPGDVVLVTKGPAVEAVGLLTTLFPDHLSLDESTLATAQSRLDETGAVRDARAIASIEGVTAMHDATEGGLVGAFHEMAGSAGVRFDIATDGIPVRPGVREATDALGMDPWRATSSGTLVVTVDPGHSDAVRDALAERGTPVGVAGVVEEGNGVVVDGETTDPPESDASWPVYERLLDEHERR